MKTKSKLLLGLATLGTILATFVIVNINNCYVITSGFFAGRTVCKLATVVIEAGQTVVI